MYIYIHLFVFFWGGQAWVLFGNSYTLRAQRSELDLLAATSSVVYHLFRHVVRVVVVVADGEGKGKAGGGEVKAGEGAKGFGKSALERPLRQNAQADSGTLPR